MNFRAMTSAVLSNFDQRYTEMVIQIIEKRNTSQDTSGTFSDIQKGYGFLVMANENDENIPFTVTTEFLVPSSELAASFMVMWRRWCDKKNISTKDGLLILIDRITKEMEIHIADGNQHSISNLAIGLMGAVLDNYPEVVSSMRWSVDNNIVPCMVIANDNKTAKCAVCFGGTYSTS